MDWKEKIEKIKLNSITINFDQGEITPLPKASSKFGGQPDLPKDFQWYYFQGESPFTPETKSRPLSFLAQINCEDIREYDIENRLPKTGILYFFYELESMAWGFSPKDRGSARVYYYDGDISKLEKAEFPKDMNEDYILPEIKFTFGRTYSAPDYEELCNDYDFHKWEDYSNFLKREGYYLQDSDRTKLLGYADSIQGDMLLECELVDNGIECGDASACNSEKREELQKNKDQWKLLFQLDTVTTKDFELMFGDCGRIFYYIKEEDLKNKKFDKSWLILQCS